MTVRFDLSIDYPVARMEARRAFRYVDRVPVGFCPVPRYFAPVFGIPW